MFGNLFGPKDKRTPQEKVFNREYGSWFVVQWYEKWSKKKQQWSETSNYKCVVDDYI